MVTTRELYCGTGEPKASAVDRVTDDQRRDVAARMRELMSECLTLPLIVAIVQVINDCLPEEGGPYAFILADLIDRSTCHVRATDHEFEDSVRCDRCHKTFARPWEPFNYCPSCGAEVVDEDGAN